MVAFDIYITPVSIKAFTSQKKTGSIWSLSFYPKRKAS